ncbi:hypothetical protein [Bartonella grahamii]|uniref:Uncharacterized protein n=1 Tax=Bartonella grahamii TaxID=33045 RepID=A0A336NB69_BARGR|nr:hypothetical protein [Bartonella grahamii]SSZ38949.1 Uncharacterised protein [Bartonella grahamii]
MNLITVLIMLQNHPKFWKEITEFVLLERIFRYPKGSDQHMTFGSGTGVLLFEILVRNKVLFETDQCYLQFYLERIKQVIVLMIADIEALEALDYDYLKKGGRITSKIILEDRKPQSHDLIFQPHIMRGESLEN